MGVLVWSTGLSRVEQDRLKAVLRTVAQGLLYTGRTDPATGSKTGDSCAALESAIAGEYKYELSRGSANGINGIVPGPPPGPKGRCVAVPARRGRTRVCPALGEESDERNTSGGREVRDRTGLGVLVCRVRAGSGAVGDGGVRDAGRHGGKRNAGPQPRDAANGRPAQRDAVASWEPKRSYRSPFDLAFSPEGGALAVSDRTGRRLYILDVQAGAAGASVYSPVPAREIELRGQPMGVAWQGGSRVVVSEYDAGTVAEVDAKTGDVLRRFSVGLKPVGVAVCREGSGRRL